MSANPKKMISMNEKSASSDEGFGIHSYKKDSLHFYGLFSSIHSLRFYF